MWAIIALSKQKKTLFPNQQKKAILYKVEELQTDKTNKFLEQKNTMFLWQTNFW